MSKEVDPRLVRFRNELGDSRKKIVPLWVTFIPLRDKTTPIEQRIKLRDQLKHLGPQWKEQIEEHIRVAKDIEAVKWELGLAIRQEEQEDRAAAGIKQDVLEKGGTFKDGKDLAGRLIRLTNKVQGIQREKRPI
jgi:hypothetical protein